MNRPQLYELKIHWFKPQNATPAEWKNTNVSCFDIPQTDSINRYARDESHGISIGKKYARETLRATGEITVKVTPIK